MLLLLLLVQQTATAEHKVRVSVCVSVPGKQLANTPRREPGADGFLKERQGGGVVWCVRLRLRVCVGDGGSGSVCGNSGGSDSVWWQ